jgi:hypothetical protein
MTRRSTLVAFARVVTAALLPMAVQCVLAAPGGDGAAQLKDLMGTYLGRAVVKDLDTNQTEEREIDVEISPFKGNGFHIRWVNVTLVEGRRDLPGVKRRISEAAFTPAKGQNFFVEAPERSVFAEREEVSLLGGNPVRWAVLDAAGLHLYAFVVLDDGRYELQTYSRRRTARGIDLYYERVVDGKRVRTINGQAVKAE